MENSGYQPAARGKCFDDIHTSTLMTYDSFLFIFGTDYGKAMNRMTNYAGMVFEIDVLVIFWRTW